MPKGVSFQAIASRVIISLGIAEVILNGEYQNKSALIPSDEIRSEELLAEQNLKRLSLRWHIIRNGMRVLGEVDRAA